MNEPLVRVHTGPRRWLVRVEDLREVVPMMALSAVDGQEGGCRGVLNLRGELVPVFDGAGPQAPLHPSRLILVLRERSGTSLGLIVDEAPEVLLLPTESLVPRPVGGGRTRRMTLVQGEFFSVLEVDALAVHGG
jgi:purine-binding chemotaxis protein CheW